jgi:hypothetical protein
MKILYIAHYKENSGWSKAAIDYILALDSIGLDVVCRNVKLTNIDVLLPNRIIELEKRDLNNIDYCIQHVLPHHLITTNKFKKNVAYFAGETNTIKHLTWFENLQNMDEVWVPNTCYKNVLLKDGLKKVHAVPHTCQIEKYSKKYDKIDFSDYNNYFKFYSIIELNDRKNIEGMLRAYYSEFTIEDDVLLVIKCRKFGLSSRDIQSHVNSISEHIKKQLRIGKGNRYPKIAIISEDSSDEEINRLHYSCDCFIGLSHGEAWSIPSFDAMCFGNTPICSNEGGPAEFINKDDINTGMLINGVYSPCTHSDPAFNDLFTGKESWFIPSEYEAQKAMRLLFEKRGTIDINAGLNRGREFNYETIGSLMKDLLND